MASVPITAPRVPIIDERTGLISRAWYMFFLSLNNSASTINNYEIVNNTSTLLSSNDAELLTLAQATNVQPTAVNNEAALRTLAQAANTQPKSTELLAQLAEVRKQIQGLYLLPPPNAGTVTGVSVVTTNGFKGTVSSGPAPALTLATTVTGVLKGNGTAISAAIANTDYEAVTGPTTYTADFTVTTDKWAINNKVGSTCTVTLPSASAWTGRKITVKNLQPQLLVSASSNVAPISSATAGTAILLNVAGNWATLVSDGTNWVIMQAAPNNVLLTE